MRYSQEFLLARFTLKTIVTTPVKDLVEGKSCLRSDKTVLQETWADIFTHFLKSLFLFNLIFTKSGYVKQCFKHTMPYACHRIGNGIALTLQKFILSHPKLHVMSTTSFSQLEIQRLSKHYTLYIK